MTSHRILVVKTSILVILIVLFNSLGNVLLGKGMKQIGEVKDWSASALGAFFVKTFTSGWIWLGMGSLLLFFVAYLLVLSWADFSYVLPATATGYAVVPLLSHFFLREAVTPVRWTGVALICMGVAFVSRTSPRTTGQG